MSRWPAGALPYHAEAWLWQKSPRAWGWHKALLHEDDAAMRARLKEIMPADVRVDIAEAYRRAGR